MAQLSPQDLLVLAKHHLSLPSSAPSASVPAVYLEELKNHMVLYPNDTHFRVTLQPKKGFGVVICLEEGCDSLAIPLVRRVKVKDGGKRDGLGSLSAYRVHIQEHATHQKKRDNRISASSSSRVPIKKESSLLDAHATHQKNRENRIGGAVASSSSRVPIKKESSLLDALDDASSPFGTPCGKPFGSPRFVMGSSSPAVADTPKSLVKRSSLVRLTPRGGVKPEPVEATIPRKRASNAVFGSSVNHEDAVTLKKPKQELSTKVPLALVNRNTKTEAPAALPPVDVDEARRNIGITQTKISHYEALYDRVQRKKTKSKTDATRMRQYAVQLDELRELKAKYDASLPRAASPIKRITSKVLTKTESLPKLPPPFYNPAAGVLAKLETVSELPLPFRLPVPNAIASGSKVRAGPTYQSDDEMDVDIDPMLVLNKVIHAIPNIAPLGGEDHMDANGDYHGRSRDTFQGPQAKADDIDRFLMEAGNAEQFDGNASVENALEKLGLQSKTDLLPSLDIPLMPHQLLGVAWMVELEKKKGMQGGCLADEMGLGKTVQMIATMCKNPSADPLCKTTLIIAPLALLQQWQMEINTKTNAGWKVLIYHGSNKPKKKADLLQYDVVLTTYSTMALEWPDLEAEEKRKAKVTKKQKANDFIASDSDSDDSGPSYKKAKKGPGLLFQVDFYRVVLDEAQNIRNKRTRVSRAVTDLSATHRWCLTATPIINGVADVYGLIRFLKVRPWYDWKEFNGHVAKYEKKNPQLAVTRLQAILNLFLIRRMKTSMLDGKRLIELPEKKVELVSLPFSQEERDIYNMVEAQQQAKFNRYLRAGTVLKNYASVLVLLLRLRQLCSHPSLIQENGVSFLAPDEADEPEEHRDELSRARAVISSEFVKQMKEKFKDRALKRIQAEKESVDATVEQEDCPICYDALTSAVVTPCGHQFCKDCLNDVFQTALPEQAGNAQPQYKPDERPCPSCRSAICSDKTFLSAAFEPTDKDLEADEDSDIEMLDAAPAKSKAKAKGKGKAKAKSKAPAKKRSARVDAVRDSETESEDDEDDDMSDFIVEDDEDEEEKDERRKFKKALNKRKAFTILDSDEESADDDTPEEIEVLHGVRKEKLTKEAIKLMPRFLPSTKMKAMMASLKQLFEEHPDEKTLIVSQWTGCLTLVSDYLTEAGIVHVKYQGDMNRNQRDQAVQVFMSKDKARIMLMSLKCGGVGLNLTRANNVIALDLGWSPAIDHQAFDRVHRLGQSRDVIVKRLVIENTVEDRILALQERKQKLADGSLGEGSGEKIGRLSVRELATLFGLDARGRVLAKD
ncbi:SNF2 superfamily protein [Mycena rebaudengoi]|nr:SNF2 superfamily protein [Mycena rebaudengoi]